MTMSMLRACQLFDFASVMEMPDEVKKTFDITNAIIVGSHFVYAEKSTGWFHGGAYVNKDAIGMHPASLSRLCQIIAQRFRDRQIEVVVGPTIGGVSLSQWTAFWLDFYNPHGPETLSVFADEADILEPGEIDGSHPEVNSIVTFNANGPVRVDLEDFKLTKVSFTVKVGTRRVLRRGYEKVVKGRRCLCVEDVINSGKTAVNTISATSFAGGNVVGLVALANRSGRKVGAHTFPAPYSSLLELDMKMFPEAECPICKEKGPESVRIDLGHGKNFLIRKGLMQDG